MFTENEIAQMAFNRWGINIRRIGREYHSPCPRCGGIDRFCIWEEGNFWCRQCDMRGWITDNVNGWKPNPEQIKQLEEERERRRLDQENLNRAWRDGHKAGYYQGWHEAMGSGNRMWWKNKGVQDEQIEFYKLGFVEKKRVETVEGELIDLPAYTAPCFDPADWDFVRNIHYRLDKIPNNVKGKYRYEKGISMVSFYAEPFMDFDRVLVVEGAVKAMVCHEFIQGAHQVVGLASSSPSPDNINELKQFKQIYLALDPGTQEQSNRLKKILPQTRIVHLPNKPDDMILAGMTKRQFDSYIHQAV